jgi:hypothetical protein
MARQSMTDVINRAVSLAGQGSVWSADVVQTYLDDCRAEARYVALEAVPSIAPGGSITYLSFDAGAGQWEGTATGGLVLLDGAYGTLTPSSADCASGRFSFASQPALPVMVLGWRYDIYEAAARLIDNLAGSVAAGFDFRDGDQQFSRSQIGQNYAAAAERLRANAWPCSIAADRSDMLMQSDSVRLGDADRW